MRGGKSPEVLSGGGLPIDRQAINGRGFAMVENWSEEGFLQDVREHRMTVLHDSGVYRHVRFAKPGTCLMQFDLVTWPGYLAFSGDVGAYVFSRLRDMFEFFRDSRPWPTGPIEVNLGYWAEKCQAQDCSSGIREYSPERFREKVEQWVADADLSEECRAAVQREVLSRAEEGEYAARQALEQFDREYRLGFEDFWEADCRDWTVRYVWCCRALCWAIHQYDAARRRAA